MAKGAWQVGWEISGIRHAARHVRAPGYSTQVKHQSDPGRNGDVWGLDEFSSCIFGAPAIGSPCHFAVALQLYVYPSSMCVIEMVMRRVSPSLSRVRSRDAHHGVRWTSMPCIRSHEVGFSVSIIDGRYMELLETAPTSCGVLKVGGF